MSRIGKLPITVPSGVEVKIDGSNVAVKGPKGELTHVVPAPITVAQNDDGQIEVAIASFEATLEAAGVSPVAHSRDAEAIAEAPPLD